MNSVILISILLFLFILVLYNYKEPFTLQLMEQNNKTQEIFCKKLGYLDEPSEELKIFLDEISDVEKQNNKRIHHLETTIKDLQDNMTKKDISIVRAKKENNIYKRDKQLELINMAHNNIKNRNNINLNII